MSHMQPEITSKQRGWSVDTQDAGACFVPDDVASVPDYLTDDAHIVKGDCVFDALCEHLGDYVEGHHIQAIKVCKGYFARLSAPGYLDATEWCCYSTLKEARDALRDYD